MCCRKNVTCYQNLTLWCLSAFSVPSPCTLSPDILSPSTRRRMVAVDPNSVKIYTVNGAPAGSSSSLPDWLIRKRAAKAKGKRAVREHVEGTIELIQHFEFPEASNRVRTTRDGHHIIATGTYKPQMRVWDLDQLALKFERHSDAENVDFIVSPLLFGIRPILEIKVLPRLSSYFHV